MDESSGRNPDGIETVSPCKTGDTRHPICKYQGSATWDMLSDSFCGHIHAGIEPCHLSR